MILGFLSDAHGNLEAFDKGLAVLAAAGAESVYFLGDAVGYLPGTAVVDALVDGTVTGVRGNHDAAVLAGVVDPRADAVLRHEETARALTLLHRAALEAMPERLELDSPVGPLLLVHGSPADPTGGYVYPDTDLAPLAGTGHRVVLMGQTHRPFVRDAGGTTFVNVGSCGLPRDCGAHGAAALLDDRTGTARIVRFDIRAETAAALKRCGPVAPEVLAVLNRRGDTDSCEESHD